MIKTSIILFVLFYMVSAHSQQTIDKLNSNQLKLPKETIQKALSIDATGQVKSSTTSDTELGYLSGVTSSVQTQINSKANDTDAVHLTGNESISGIKTFTGRLETSSTTNASLPCPVMTQSQRDLIASPVVGDCVFNDDVDQANIYDGSIWKSMGGSGGISLWLTATGYAVDDVVIESNNIYICLTAHTSGTFATDLAATKWLRVSTDVSGATGLLPLANGGTAKNITASNGAIAYSDTDSLELLAPGTSGQILQANGVAAPTFVNKSISVKAENGSSLTLEELQVSNNSLTQTATNKYLLDNCNSSNNLLANCGFEHSTPASGWTLTNGSSAVDTATPKFGKQALKLTLTAQALDFYQTSTLNAAAFADGVNGSISLHIKTTVDNVYLCRTDSAGAVVANTDGTKITNCVLAPNSGKWSELTMPIILGATSNGIRLVSLTPSTAASVAVTGDVYIDQGILEAGLKVADYPSINTQSSRYSQTADYTNAVITGTPVNIGGGVYSYSAGTYTLLVNANVTASMSFRAKAASTVEGTFRKGGVIVARSNTQNSTGYTATVSYTGRFLKGETFYFDNNSSATTDVQAISVSAYEVVDNKTLAIPSDSFSTDTNQLSHKTSALTSANAIGDYVTYSYAINTNTKTICGTAPSILPNAADGFKIFTRAYNAASTCGNPARVEIKIAAAGTKLPTIKTDIYKSAAKSIAGMTDYVLSGTSEAYGLRFKEYEESTGVLTIDIALNGTSITNAGILFTDNSSQTNGFLVINAQKAKDSIIGSFAEVVTTPTLTKPVVYSARVAFSGSVVMQKGSWLTSVTNNATGDLSLNIPSGKFSTNPICSCTPETTTADGGFYTCNQNLDTLSTTQIRFKGKNNSNAMFNVQAQIVCHGEL